MGVEFFEIEFARDQEEDSSDGRHPAIASGFAFGSLEKAIERLKKTVGHAASRLCDMANYDHFSGKNWVTLLRSSGS